MTLYRRRPAKTWEELAAAAVGVVVGMGSYYLARVWLQREPLDRPIPTSAAPTSGRPAPSPQLEDAEDAGRR